MLRKVIRLAKYQRDIKTSFSVKSILLSTTAWKAGDGLRFARPVVLRRHADRTADSVWSARRLVTDSTEQAVGPESRLDV